jgi:hypothetical protein
VRKEIFVCVCVAKIIAEASKKFAIILTPFNKDEEKSHNSFDSRERAK